MYIYTYIHIHRNITNYLFLDKLTYSNYLCSVNVGLYPNIPHGEGLSAVQKRLELRREKKVSTSMFYSCYGWK